MWEWHLRDGGDCTCTVGYEKDATGKCSVEERAKFLGNWAGIITYSGPLSGTGTITLPITQGASLQKVVINNLFTCQGASLPISATVAGSNINNMAAVTCDDGTTVSDISFSAVSLTATGSSLSIFLNYTISLDGVVYGSGTATGTLSK